MFNLADFLNTYIIPYGFKLVLAIVILIVGFLLAKGLAKSLSKSNILSKADPNAQNLIVNIVKTAIRVLTVFTAVMVLGVPQSSVVAVIASCGLAIGLALQGGLSNIAAGLIIMVCKPFHVGDFIIAGDITGVVQEIGLFYTKVLTPDNLLITSPNSTLSGATVTNLSAEEIRRVDFDLRVNYNTDIELARKVLLAVAQSNDLVLKEPESQVFIHQHDTSALGVKLRIWCKSSDYWTVYFDMWEDVKKAFDKFGIEIPYQHINVIVDKDEEE